MCFCAGCGTWADEFSSATSGWKATICEGSVEYHEFDVVECEATFLQLPFIMALSFVLGLQWHMFERPDTRSRLFTCTAASTYRCGELHMKAVCCFVPHSWPCGQIKLHV